MSALLRASVRQFAGFPVTIETPIGSRRKPEWPVNTADYGYFIGTRGRDGEDVDVFLRSGVKHWTGPAFVIDQGDETKTMIGWCTAEEARDAYLSHHSPGWDRIKSITQMSMDQLGAWLRSNTALVKYSDDQPRDEHGRWASGGTEASWDAIGAGNDIKIGRLWHVTDKKSFEIDPKRPALYLTTDNYLKEWTQRWVAGRPYAAEINPGTNYPRGTLAALAPSVNVGEVVHRAPELARVIRVIPIAQALREAAQDKVSKYSDDQERDDHGRWTDGGGGVSPAEQQDLPTLSLKESAQTAKDKIGTGRTVAEKYVYLQEYADIQAQIAYEDVMRGETYAASDSDYNEALNEGKDDTSLTADRAQAAAVIEHDAVMRTETGVNSTEAERQTSAYGDQKIMEDNRVWGEALDSYIGPGYDEINGIARGIDRTELVNEDELKERVNSYLNEYEFDTSEDSEVESRIDSAFDDNFERLAQESDEYKELFEGYKEERDEKEATPDMWGGGKHETDDEIATRAWAEFQTSPNYEDLRDDLESQYRSDLESQYRDEVRAEREQMLEDMREEVEDEIREQMVEENQERLSEAEHQFEELKKLISSRPPTTHPLILYRGIKTGESLDWDTLEAGDAIQLQGLTSTSTKYDVADGWGSKVMHIVVPVGSTGVLLTTNDKEGEVILNHNGTLSVIGKSNDNRHLLAVFKSGVEKMEHKRIYVNFGRMQTEPLILDKPLAKYSDDQERDERGRWSGGGASDSQGNPIVDYHGKPVPLNPDGTLTLYHRTTPKAAAQITRSGSFTSKENTQEVYFSNRKTGQAEGYGDAVVEVKLRPSQVRSNDIFPSGEVHFAADRKSLTRANIVPIKKYSDDQERDEHGRWTDGGGLTTSGGFEGSMVEGKTSGLNSKEMIRAAIKEFGTTDSPLEAGYILPDGTMLDFSGKREGGSPGVRSYDHREIGRAFEDTNFVGGSEGMREFMEVTGAVRSSANAGFIAVEVAQTLSPKQIDILARATRGRDVSWDVSHGGEILHSGETDADTSDFRDVADRINQHLRNERIKAKMAAKFDEDQPRDDHGRWTDAGGGSAAMKERLLPPGAGFTMSTETGREPTSGYAVSPYPDRSVAVPIGELTEDTINDYLKRNSDILSKPDHYFGPWHDAESNKVFLDVSVVVKSGSDAERLCKEHDQIGYFHLDNKEYVEVNRAATSGGAAKVNHGKIRKQENWKRATGPPVFARYQSAQSRSERGVAVSENKSARSGAEKFGTAGQAVGKVVIARLRAAGARPFLFYKFDEDQPRDDHGRWTTGGGGEVAPASSQAAHSTLFADKDSRAIQEWVRDATTAKMYEQYVERNHRENPDFPERSGNHLDNKMAHSTDDYRAQLLNGKDCPISKELSQARASTSDAINNQQAAYYVSLIEEQGFDKDAVGRFAVLTNQWGGNWDESGGRALRAIYGQIEGGDIFSGDGKLLGADEAKDLFRQATGGVNETELLNIFKADIAYQQEKMRSTFAASGAMIENQFKSSGSSTVQADDKGIYIYRGVVVPETELGNLLREKSFAFGAAGSGSLSESEASRFARGWSQSVSRAKAESGGDVQHATIKTELKAGEAGAIVRVKVPWDRIGGSFLGGFGSPLVTEVMVLGDEKALRGKVTGYYKGPLSATAKQVITPERP